MRVCQRIFKPAELPHLHAGGRRMPDPAILTD